MTEIEKQIEALTTQLQDLRNRQIQLNTEMIGAERLLQALKAIVLEKSHQEGEVDASANVLEQQTIESPTPPVVQPTIESPYIFDAKRKVEERKRSQKQRSFHVNRELEDFIGTNVISKVGILVTIIGVFIGAKYAIDNELISPLMRIIAGYLAGAALISVSFRLKKKYAYFSSILVGGGLAVTYFITYIAFSFYALFPLSFAFAIMVITTIAAVAIALWYNEKVIALLGQVAAYAIPFLLGDRHGNVFMLLSYITCINFGLLILSFKKDWKLLYHIAFFVTGLIYLFSFVLTDHLRASLSGDLIFLTLNFITFYITFLSYKIYRKELYQAGEIAILLLNALLFFFIGCFVIDQKLNNMHFLTFFTIANAGIHLAAGYFIYRLSLVDNSVFQFILGLGLLFITVAIPIELDGNWVTILWTIESTVLFYVAHNTGRQLYLKICLPLVIISFISLLQDWSLNYSYISSPIGTRGVDKTPFFNLNFTFSLVVSTCFGYVSYYSSKIAYNGSSLVGNFFSKILPVGFLAILYLTFFHEIHFYWDENINSANRHVLVLYQTITLIIFSCLYLAAWLLVNTRIIKRENLHHLLIVLSLLINGIFLFEGLYTLSNLRDLYISTGRNAATSFAMVRYVSLAALVILWLSARNSFRVFKPAENVKRSFSNLFNITLLTIVSNEFIHWMDLAGYQNQYKLGLSLIWGTYALALLFTGMIKKKKHFRIFAILLFAVTLLKLFFLRPYFVVYHIKDNRISAFRNNSFTGFLSL